MREEPPESIRKGFPRTWYFPKWKLLGWFPRGVLNEAFADQVIAFVEMEERIQDAPFDRYADLSGLSAIRYNFDHIFQIARRRQKVKQPVKSALFASQPLAFSVAQTYARMMAGGMIEVRAFEDRAPAAKWLEVLGTALTPPS
jgi:hypothetical protein